MSMLEPEDIALWEEQKMENKTWQVEEMETIKVDEHGIEEDTWKGYGVSKISDTVNYCFLCRDEEAAKDLCEFLNEECNIDDTSVEDYALDNCIEWANLIRELSKKEIRLYHCKEAYQGASESIIEATDFKALYGKNNESIRKQHVKEELADEYAEIKELELSIDYLKRRISYLRQLVPLKTTLLEVKRHV